MLQILSDALQSPRSFDWFGSIAEVELLNWASVRGLDLPRDLFVFWCATGGGDAFESETLLRPDVRCLPDVPYFFQDTDLVEFRAGLLLFHKGIFSSAFRLQDRKYVVRRDSNEVEDVFDSFDDWYVRNLRAEYAGRYGLTK